MKPFRGYCGQCTATRTDIRELKITKRNGKPVYKCLNCGAITPLIPIEEGSAYHIPSLEVFYE